MYMYVCMYKLPKTAKDCPTTCTYVLGLYAYLPHKELLKRSNIILKQSSKECTCCERYKPQGLLPPSPSTLDINVSYN